MKDEPMSLHEALCVAISELYGLLDTFELMDPEEQQTMWINPPEALREAARVLDTHYRECKHHDRQRNTTATGTAYCADPNVAGGDERCTAHHPQ